MSNTKKTLMLMFAQLTVHKILEWILFENQLANVPFNLVFKRLYNFMTQ